MVIRRQHHLLAIFLGMAIILALLQQVNIINGLGFCWFKELTGLPCFSCGSTRALAAVLHGDILKSLQINPVLLVTLLLATLFGFSYISDYTLHTQFLKRMAASQRILKRPPVYSVLILAVLANWIWNITKGL